MLTGKVGIREGTESFSANLLWRQQAEGFRMDLWGPLGQGRVEIVNKGSQIQLRNGQGLITEGDPDQVMREQLGWTLPLTVLPSWVQGQPLADVQVSAARLDEAGRLAAFEQLGWSVALDRYEAVTGAAGERQLPTRITATRAETRVRVVVADWQL
ncbi:MAG: lipoprotein insertase outer membrane protein LolB [Pseudomonadota bacterium]